MTLLAADKISKHFNEQVILDSESFTLLANDRIALVGKNGIGKTTLLEILAGKQEIDEGTITYSRTCEIDYIEQEKDEYLEHSLFDFVAQARADLLEMRQRMREIEEALTLDPTNEKYLKDLGELQHRFEQGGGFDFENEIGTILHGLGFPRERFDDRVRNFSGGEKNRAGLARILAGKGNLLLLDEPTNHLDIESTAWLEDYLTKLGKAYIIVSHDRAFLDATVTQVWELAFGKLETYVGNYEKYMQLRAERRRLQEHHYKHQQEEIARIQDFIQRNMAGQKTKQAQSKLKYLNRIKRLPPPKTDTSGPAISMQSSGRSWAHVLKLEDVAVGYGDTVVLEDVSFDLYRGDKVGLIGRNGSGKTSLLKTLTGELTPIDGTIALGNKVDVAYFDQELSELNEQTTVLDNLWEVDPGAESNTIRSWLGRFGFSGEEVMKPVAALSGGEKTKLSLAKLLYYPANLVILDEPTNHLDIKAREALEAALREYDGTCLVVSHDRYFLDKVAEKIVHVANGHARVYNGGYSYFKEKVAEHTTAEPVSKKDDSSKQEYLSFKEQSKQRARLKRQIKDMRERIENLEAELHRIEGELDGGIPEDDWEKLQEATNRRHEIENEILELYDRLEELEQTPDD